MGYPSNSMHGRLSCSLPSILLTTGQSTHTDQRKLLPLGPYREIESCSWLSEKMVRPGLCLLSHPLLSLSFLSSLGDSIAEFINTRE